MKIAVISDVHGNLPALSAVLSEIDRIGCGRIVSLGDVSGYYAEPADCLDELVSRGATQLLGNHDNYLVQGGSCDRSKLVSELIIHQRKEMSPRHLGVLREMTSQVDEEDRRYVHGSWENPVDGYLYRVTLEDLPGPQKFFFAGHTHVQFLGTIGEKTFCNPGSVGQPRDGDPRAAFAVCDGGSVSLHRVEYDIEKTILAMRRVGYTAPYLWENLRIGAQIGGRIDRITIE